MEPNTKGLFPDSFKPLQNKAFIVFNALFDHNVSGSTIKLPEEPEILDSLRDRSVLPHPCFSLSLSLLFGSPLI